MIFYQALSFVILTSCATGEIFVSDDSFPNVKIPQAQQRQIFFRLPGLVAPPPVPVPAPAPYVAPRPVPYVAPRPVPYVAPQPAPILSPSPTVSISTPVNAQGITRVPGSTLQPCSSKCCIRYCKLLGKCDSTKKKTECAAPSGNAPPATPADKCYNAEADGCLPKQCTMPTSCKNPCSTVIDIVTNVAFCDP